MKQKTMKPIALLNYWCHTVTAAEVLPEIGTAVTSAVLSLDDH
jgi:hypothetical protein